MAVRDDGVGRRFGCTACGRCCDRGPEMELGEAGALASTFVTFLLFRVHSQPLSDRSARAVSWWREQGSRIPLRPAFEEKRRHLAAFASRRRSERRNEREVYLTISAIVGDYAGARCPALDDGRCGIYDRRPLGCRTVPLHYSRPPSTLQAYLDQFTATPGYACDTAAGPEILRGNIIVSSELRRERERAMEAAKADRPWKEHLLAAMDAGDAGLPSFEEVLGASDRGFATMLPMISAWRVAVRAGLLAPAAFARICGEQAALIRAEVARSAEAEPLRSLLPLYDAGAAQTGGLSLAAAQTGCQ